MTAVSLSSSLNSAKLSSHRFLADRNTIVPLRDLIRGSSLCSRLDELRGRSALVLTRDQLSAALAMIELDGVCRRLVLWPSDLPAEQVSSILATASIDAIVSDASGVQVDRAVAYFVSSGSHLTPINFRERGSHRTEWILLTSGTTGRPKLVMHTLSTLAAPILAGVTVTRDPIVWTTFYDIRRYGGLQIFLRAILGGGSLVLSGTDESTTEFMIRAGTNGITHISGTPSHWRGALMSGSARRIDPQYVRVSGEIADQRILDDLSQCYPRAKIAHAFASTEAGVAFSVEDGLAGFPTSLIGRPRADVAMRIEDGSLRIRSTRMAVRFLGEGSKSLTDNEGFIDTGDMVERRDNRYYFIGRKDGVINVGGRKVHPEEVESVLNSHPAVQASLAKPRNNPITGAIVVADIVLTDNVTSRIRTSKELNSTGALKTELLDFCHRALQPYKVPATFRFVESLAVAASGKLLRRNA